MVSRDGLPTVSEMLQWAVLFLKKPNRLEIELLLAHSLSWSREKVLAYPEKVLNKEEVSRFQELIKALAEGEPLQYLLGKQNFMGLDFVVDKNVLIPRSDTEVLVEEIIKIAPEKTGLKILDLCTGSGAIAISLAKHLPGAELIATDISPEALQIAQVNSLNNQVNHKITFYQGDLFEPLTQDYKFDFVVSNPPYITSQEMQELAPQVKREPHLALWGGADGLDFYRRITKQAPAYLKPDGFLLLEIGYQQGQEVKQLCEDNGFREVTIIKDWSDNDRVVKAYMR